MEGRGGGGDVLCSGVWISYQKEGCCWTVRRCLQANAILSESVSLRTPGGERVQLQIINSVTVKQKSRTCLSLDASLRLRGLASVFVARTNQSLF